MKRQTKYLRGRMKTNKLTAISYSNRPTDRQIDEESVIIYRLGGGFEGIAWFKGKGGGGAVVSNRILGREYKSLLLIRGSH